MYPPQTPQVMSGICVKADFFFLQWMLFLVKPVVTINGYPSEISWNNPVVFPLPPGNHAVKIHFPWIFTEGNVVNQWVPVHMGYVTDLKYSTSFFIFSAGNLTNNGFRPWGS